MSKLLKKSHISILATVGTLALTACGGEDTWEKYQDWYETNNAWYIEEMNRTNPDGTLYYTQLRPSWNPASGVLIHYHNDRSLTEGNLSPMITSTISAKYVLSLYGGVRVDSSYLLPDSLFVTKLNGVVTGWQVALSDMRCGDSATIVVPFSAGYGSTGSGSINPYSTLKFDLKLVDIPYYEVEAQ